MTTREWKRVNRSRPCPICGRGDWCLVTADGSAVLCPRVESDRRCGEAGFLHQLGQRPARDLGPAVRRVHLNAFSPELAALAERCEANLSPGALDRLSRLLSVSAASLERLRVGWDGEAWTFPMCDAAGRIVGIRRRLPSSRKLSVRGGREGLFLPKTDTGQPPRKDATSALFIAEGPTDTAALLMLGLDAVGRPSCTGAVRYCCGIARGREVVIVADADEPGRRGAQALAAMLCVFCLSVRIVFPPPGLKDARDWVRAGASAADIQRAVDAVEPLRLHVKGVRHG